MITPAIAAIPLLVLMRRWLRLSSVKGAVDAVVIASGVLLLSSALQMGADALRELANAL
jgi:chromate transport protein ChrA